MVVTMVLYWVLEEKGYLDTMPNISAPLYEISHE